MKRSGGSAQDDERSLPPAKARKLNDKEWPVWVLEADNGKKLVPKQFKHPIVPYVPPPDAPKQRGGIRVLKIYNRFAPVPKEWKKWPEIDGYERFNVCKNNRYQDLSPMVLGPVYDENGKLYAHTIEDGWQCSKVWPFHLQGCDPDLDDEWEENWQEWSRRGRFSRESRRHRTPKGGAASGDQQVDQRNKNIPLFSYYMGDKIPYKEARKRMYMRWYEETVKETVAYKDLKARHMSGQNLLLLEFDGLDRNDPEENRDLTEEMLLKLLDDDSRPFGHGLVLACCLLDMPVWRYTPRIGKMTLWNRVKKHIEETVFESYDAEHDEWIRASRGEPDYSRGYSNVTFHDPSINKELREAEECFKLAHTNICVRMYTPYSYECLRFFRESYVDECGCKFHQDVQLSTAAPPTCEEHRQCTQKLPFKFEILLEVQSDDKRKSTFEDGDMYCEAVQVELPYKMRADGTLRAYTPRIEWGL